MLADSYERLLANEGIGSSVLAYRQFTPPKCNIHFANDAFGFVEENAPCVAMAFDVKEFFESLDHKLLKQQWQRVLGAQVLPADHYAVFKAVTRYAYVERDALRCALGISKKKLAVWRGPLCTPYELRNLVRASGLIKPKTDGKGIPQGSPISALLSNVYMLPIDLRLSAFAREHAGMYLRYSDDILVVCPPEAKSSFEAEVGNAMKAVSLSLDDGPGKFTVAAFSKISSTVLTCDRSLQYLGFTFDGAYVRIRSQTVVRYLRRMHRAVRREKYLAKRSGEMGGDPRIRRKRLYSGYTHLGKRNFISYAKQAQDVFDKNAIRSQIKHHWRDLHAALVLE